MECHSSNRDFASYTRKNPTIIAGKLACDPVSQHQKGLGAALVGIRAGSRGAQGLKCPFAKKQQGEAEGQVGRGDVCGHKTVYHAATFGDAKGPKLRQKGKSQALSGR